MTEDSDQHIVDFLIVGSMKAGSTSLHHWLMQSESIAMTDSETHFFDRDNRFGEGLVGYQKRLPKVSSSILVGDDTPTYSYLPEVPGRIRSLVPRVKILWVLRDPIQRAISKYWYAALSGMLMPYQCKRFVRWSTHYRKTQRPVISPPVLKEANAYLQEGNKGVADLVGFTPK